MIRLVLAIIIGLITVKNVCGQDTVKIATIDSPLKYRCYYRIYTRPVLITSKDDFNRMLGRLWTECNQLSADSCKIDFHKYCLVVWDTVVDADRIVKTEFYKVKDRRYVFAVNFGRPPEFSHMMERRLMIWALIPRLKRREKFEFIIQKRS